jgi:ankyrin repeat protein
MGADPLEVDMEGYSLLHEASNIGNLEMIKMLLSVGCNPKCEANDGSTPIMWAAQHNNDDLMTTLVNNLPEK